MDHGVVEEDKPSRESLSLSSSDDGIRSFLDHSLRLENSNGFSWSLCRLGHLPPNIQPPGFPLVMPSGSSPLAWLHCNSLGIQAPELEGLVLYVQAFCTLHASSFSRGTG